MGDYNAACYPNEPQAKGVVIVPLIHSKKELHDENDVDYKDRWWKRMKKTCTEAPLSSTIPVVSLGSPPKVPRA